MLTWLKLSAPLKHPSLGPPHRSPITVSQSPLPHPRQSSFTTTHLPTLSVLTQWSRTAATHSPTRASPVSSQHADISVCVPRVCRTPPVCSHIATANRLPPHQTAAIGPASAHASPRGEHLATRQPASRLEHRTNKPSGASSPQHTHAPAVGSKADRSRSQGGTASAVVIDPDHRARSRSVPPDPRRDTRPISCHLPPP